MIGKVVSGAQTGVDQAALLAARSCGIPTGGFAPKGWKTEAGEASWVKHFGVVEAVGGYAHRTQLNVLSAHGTLILLYGPDSLTGGTLLTHKTCTDLLKSGKTFCVADLLHSGGFDQALAFVRSLPDGSTLNIAGPRESKYPGIGIRAQTSLCRLFEALKELPRGNS